jgi:hypothetical protein
MRRRHLRRRHPHVLNGQVLQRDRPDNREQGPQRVPVDFDRFGGPIRQPLGQPVGNSLLDHVPVHSPHARVEFGVHLFELVSNLSLGLAADLLANPLTVRVEAERDHAAPAPVTGPVTSAIPAICPVIEVDAVFAIASTLSMSRVPKRNVWLPQWLPSKTAATRKSPLTCTYSVELRGFEPLTPSMRTRCATGLRYSPKNESQRSKLCLLLAPPMSWALVSDGADPTMARLWAHADIQDVLALPDLAEGSV